ncbi:MAG: hypothetical protein ACYTGF_08465 [Planctomycetota bacterium]|jgi:hypothetical protein
MRLTRVLKWTAMASFAAVVAMWIGSIFTPFMFAGLGRLAGGALIITGFTLVALACATTLEQGRCMALMWSGIAAAALSGTGWVAFSLQQAVLTPRAEQLWASWLVPSTCWAGLCVVIGLVRQRRQPSAVGVWLGRATIAGAALLAAAIPPAVWFDMGRRQADVVRSLGALAVLIVMGMVATMVIARLRQLEGVEDQEHVRLDFTATCPRCELRQPMITGGDVCRHCGLRVKVIVP